MKNLITLVKMQLKEKLNLKSLELGSINPFKLLTSVVFAILKFAVVTAVFAVVLSLINFLGVFNLVQRTPTTVMSIAFGIMLIASVISCTAGLTKAIYFSRDNAILLTLPCKPVQVFLSKLIIFFAFELKRNFNFMIPLFVAFYILHGYPILSYLWLIVCFVFISLFTVILGALLSIPAMWISNVFRQNRYLQIGTLVTLVSAVVIALFYAVSLIPKNLDLLSSWPLITMDIQNGVNVVYPERFKAFYDMTTMFLGEGLIYATFPIGATLIKFLILLGIIIGLSLLVMLIVLPLFYKMASTPFEYLKKAVKPGKNRVHSGRIATFVTEMIIAIKNPTRMFTNVGVLISIPLLTFLLNRLFFAMNTDELGDNLVIAFNILIIMLISLNANAPLASIYSRDGRAAYLIKTQPTKPELLLFSKLLPDMIFGIISLALTLIILITSSNIGVINAIFFIISIILIYIAHAFYCAELDIMNPQYEIYATVGASDSNPNETKATLTAFIISFLAAAAGMLLLMDKSDAISLIRFTDTVSLDTVYLKFFGVGLACMIYRVYLYFSKIKLYYKEK
ncbi:MAG: hypothetical protein IJX58_03165 [Clostridia bacterium]|nr:hypothetical protein [Clostridia bacterium]